jgi:hypothetical protein
VTINEPSPNRTRAAYPALELDNVDAGYDHTTVLRGVSLAIPAG